MTTYIYLFVDSFSIIESYVCREYDYIIHVDKKTNKVTYTKNISIIKYIKNQ